MQTFRPSEQDTTMRAAVEWAADRIFARVPGDYCIAGGAIRRFWSGEASSDSDLFFASAEDRSAVITAVLALGGELLHADQKLDALSVKLYVPACGTILDMVHHERRNGVESTLQSFDFTCCIAAVRRDGALVCHEDFAQHASDRRLKALRTGRPAAFLIHLAKLTARGFKLDWEDAEEIGRMLKVADEKENWDSSCDRRQLQPPASPPSTLARALRWLLPF